MADNLCEEREDDRVHYSPGLGPLDFDKRIVEQAKFMGIHIKKKVELKNVYAGMLKPAFLIEVHHCGDGGTIQTDEPPGGFQGMLTQFQDLFGKPTFANSLNGRGADYKINTDPNGKILFHSPYLISQREEAELRR